MREAEMLAKRTRLVAIDRAPINPDCTEFSLPTQADALALPFADHAFDAVFIFDVLEHVDGDDLVLKEIHRVLTPEGRLLITVPAFMFLYGRHSDVVSEHKRRYRRGPLARLLEETGFDVEYASYFNTVLFPPIAAMRLLRRIFPERNGDRGASDFDMLTSTAYRENARVLVLGRAPCRRPCPAPLRHLHSVTPRAATDLATPMKFDDDPKRRFPARQSLSSFVFLDRTRSEMSPPSSTR